LQGGMRPEALEGLVESAQTSLVSEQTAAAPTSDDRGADESSRQAIFMVSASDLTVHQAYRSGGARPIYYNSAIRYDRARDGAVPQKTLFFGPYARLPAGRYAFRFDGEIDGKLALAFTANGGARQIARFEVTSFDEPVVVELSAPVEKFEIVGAKTPSLKHLVLRGAFAEFRGSPVGADDEAATQRDAESDAEAGKGPEPAPSKSAAIAEAEREAPSAQPEAAPRAEELAPARDAHGNALSLPFALPADKLSVHDAYGAGSQNRLRVGATISFDSESHADVAESRLFYGPYLHLEPGDYRFRFRGALNGSLKLRFTKAFGAECLREVVVTDFEAPVCVLVAAAAEKVEIVGERLKDTKSMTISSIELAIDSPTPVPSMSSASRSEDVASFDSFTANDVVASLYRAILNREPDPQGFKVQLDHIRSKGIRASVKAFLSSEEYRTLLPAGTPAEVAAAFLFAIVYNRTPTEGERQWLSVLDVTNTHAAIRRIIGATDRQRLSTSLHVRFGPDDFVWAQLPGFRLAIDLADISVSQPILSEKSYEPHVTGFMRRRLQQGMHVIDVGANIGYFTILAATLVGPEGRVTAFEPNSENARLILLDIEINQLKNVRLFPVALSNTTGAAYFSPHLGSNGGFLPRTLHTLQDPKCIVVPTFRLQELVSDRIDFVKIDVEGAESMVVDGGWSLIERDRPLLVSEFSPEMLGRISRTSAAEYLHRFLRIGYRVFVLERIKEDGVGVEIVDVDHFVSAYGSDTRIEDLALLPRGA
jgi:FkbM family methyltransferase